MAQDLAGEHPEGVVLDHRVAGEQRVAERRRDREGEKRQSAEDRERDPVAAGQSRGAHLWLSLAPSGKRFAGHAGRGLGRRARVVTLEPYPSGSRRATSVSGGRPHIRGSRVGRLLACRRVKSLARPRLRSPGRTGPRVFASTPRRAPPRVAWPAGVARLRVFWRWTRLPVRPLAPSEAARRTLRPRGDEARVVARPPGADGLRRDDGDLPRRDAAELAVHVEARRILVLRDPGPSARAGLQPRTRTVAVLRRRRRLRRDAAAATGLVRHRQADLGPPGDPRRPPRPGLCRLGAAAARRRAALQS